MRTLILLGSLATLVLVAAFTALPASAGTAAAAPPIVDRTIVSSK